MIPNEKIESAANILMEKAAIEIPDDYLEGLKATAAVEDGDLSSFVLQAMLENYEAAKQDRRAISGRATILTFPLMPGRTRPTTRNDSPRTVRPSVL